MSSRLLLESKCWFFSELVVNIRKSFCSERNSVLLANDEHMLKEQVDTECPLDVSHF